MSGCNGYGDRLACPTCHEEMRFHGIDHVREYDSVADYIHYVEKHTCRPNF